MIEIFGVTVGVYFRYEFPSVPLLFLCSAAVLWTALLGFSVEIASMLLGMGFCVEALERGRQIKSKPK